MNGQAALPRKTREVLNHHIDSRVWNGFQLRGDDVIIDTYGKSGTTWVQQIVAQLLSQGAENLPVRAFSIWLDSRVNPRRNRAALEAQKHRRIIKSHLPLDALPYTPKPKYIYIARDGRDAVWSFYTHLTNATDLYYRVFNETPGRIGPPLERPDPDVRRFFRRWLEEDGYPFWPYWDHIHGWWAARSLPNVLLLHFNDLKQDLKGEIRRIAAFLGYDVAEQCWPAIIEHCSFDYMKRHAALFVPFDNIIFAGGAQSFMHSGVNGRWRDILTQDDVADFERMAVEQLGEACAAWLESGSHAATA